MLACRLRWLLFFYLLGAGAVAAWLAPAGIFSALALAIVLLPALLAATTLAITVTTYVFVASSRVMRGGSAEIEARPTGLVRSILGEWLAMTALFGCIQPLEPWLMRPDQRGDASRQCRCVLLVHGYLCNRGLWWWLRRRIEAAGFRVATLDLEPPFGSIEDFADQLQRRVQALEAELGGDGRVVAIAHSMGGLVTREYLRRRPVGRIGKIVTLGTPHCGTTLARLGLGRCAREMSPGSAFLRRLGGEPPPTVPLVSVHSTADNFLEPSATGALAGSRAITLHGIGHLSMLFSPRVCDIVLEEIRNA